MNDKRLLLLLERERALIPMNPMALTVAQNSLRKLTKAYVGEQILDLDGNLYRIREIDTRGYYGESVGRKLLSALTGARSISVDLERQPQPSLDELKGLVSRFLRYDAQTPDPLLPQREPIDSVVKRIDVARSIQEIFSAFEIPALEDCLDVL